MASLTHLQICLGLLVAYINLVHGLRLQLRTDSYNPCDGIREFFPDPVNCSKFYHCDGVIASHKDCPDGLHWDITSNRCEWKEIAQCGGPNLVTDSLPATHQTKKSKKEEPIQNTTPTTLQSTPAHITPLVYNPCDGNHEFFPDPVDCTKFYHCDGHLAYHKDCPSNLHWDVKTNRCEWPEIAQCGSSGPVTTLKPRSTKEPKISTQSSDPEYNPCDGIHEFFPDPVDCTKFYHCDGFHAYHKDCPSNLNWDVKTNTCQWPEIAQCGSSSIVTTPEPGKTTTKRTSSGEKSTTNVHTATTRGQDTTSESYPATTSSRCTTSHATQRTTESEPQTTKTTTAARTTAPGPQPTKTTTNAGTTAPEPLPTPEFDLCGTHVLYADPLNCTNFYYCINGVPNLHTCPNGKEWNALTNRCECHRLCGCTKSVP